MKYTQPKLEFVTALAKGIPIWRDHGHNIKDLIGWAWPSINLLLVRCGNSGQFGTN